MRPITFFGIILICLAILLVDILAFYWLQVIIKLIASSLVKTAINIAFWFFTIGLITAILILKIRLDSISYQRKYLLVSSMYGLAISSFIPKLIFVVVISILFFTNYVFADKESLILVPLLGLFSGVFPFFVIVYAIFRSLYRFKVRQVTIKHEELPEEFEGLRIVHISDTHLGSFNARYHIFYRAVNMINNLEPDLIFFTGDLVNNFAYELDGWKSTFEQLRAKKGKYSVLGNHDYGDYHQWESQDEKQANFEAIKKFHHNIGFTLLLNEAEVIKINQDSIAVIGVENWGSPPFIQYGNLAQAIAPVMNIPFKILLSHDPAHWQKEVLNGSDIAITLSGHTHGMQAGINFMYRKWSPIQYKYKEWAGLYKEGSQYLYVNRGLGWLGFPGRLGMRPEITSIELFKK